MTLIALSVSLTGEAETMTRHAMSGTEEVSVDADSADQEKVV